MGEDIIRQFLEQVKARVLADGWLDQHAVPVHIENTGDILYEVEKALAGAGIALILKAPRAVAETPAFIITLELLALESPTLNRGRANAATALDTVWHVALALRGGDFNLKTIEHQEAEFGFQARATLEAMVMIGTN